jgi:heme/copper-type cytochrome/quinol oxidase subunit 2
MNEGLIWTYEGRVIICLILAFLGLIVATVLTVVVFIRKAPGMRTQTNRQTGMVEDHIAVIAFAVFVVAMLVAAGLGIRANHRATRPAPEPAPILPAPEPVVGWSMPTPERQWDQR